MIELLSNPSVWVAFATLTIMEVVLGIDNIIFIAIVVGRLPPEQRDRARRLGLILAIGSRLLLPSTLLGLVTFFLRSAKHAGHLQEKRRMVLISGEYRPSARGEPSECSIVRHNVY